MFRHESTIRAGNPSEQVAVAAPTAPRQLRPFARGVFGAVVGAVVGAEIAFALVLYYLFSLGRSHPQAGMLMWYAALIGAALGAIAGMIGGWIWGRLARTVLAFFVLALAGGIAGAFLDRKSVV